MAQAVETTIEINGVRINQFTTLKLSQGIYAHHSFQLVCPLETVENGGSSIFKESKNLIGVPIRINVVSKPGRSELLFVGIVTQMEATCNNGHPGCVVISGYSPTIILDNNPYCDSWLRNSVKGIVEEVVKNYPSDTMTYKINPAYPETIYYCVQYKETAWQFISRLAGKYGEWLFYDGQKLVLGAPNGKKVKLNYGEQLSRVALHMQLKPGKFQVKAFDYVNNEVFESKVVLSEINAGHNELGKYAITKSAQLVGGGPTVNWHNHFVRSKKQVDDAVSLRAACHISDVVQLNGCSDLPGFQPGDSVLVKMREAKDPSDRSLGDYTVISIEHNWDGMGNYSNEFVAVPATVKVPPVKPMAEPYCEMQSAVVVANDDKAKLGRVQVKFHWMEEPNASPWLRVVCPYAGNGKGMFMLPEKGEEVIVSFAGGKATRPYVVGTVYNGGAKAEFGQANNNIKAIQTRSGIKIIMDDKEGSVSMEDRKGNKLKMDGDKAILIEAKGNLKLKCGDAELDMKDGEITLRGKKVNINTSDDLNIECNAKANINAATDLNMQAGVIRLN